MPIRVAHNKISKISRVSIGQKQKTRKPIDNAQLRTLLESEDDYVLAESYFGNGFQKNVHDDMRTRLVLWMLEVCEEQQCTDQVYSLAVNIFDRLLSTLNVHVRHLQLLGCVCLSIASDLTSGPLDAHMLCDYSDNAIRPEELLNWKSLVIYRLNDSLKSTVPNDYLDALLNSMDKRVQVDAQRFHRLTALCSTKLSYATHAASAIATACLLNSVTDEANRQQVASAIIRTLNMHKCVNTHTVADLVHSISSDFKF
jgi:hypothetical protein